MDQVKVKVIGYQLDQVKLMRRHWGQVTITLDIAPRDDLDLDLTQLKPDSFVTSY